jgi:hypothetical protein
LYSLLSVPISSLVIASSVSAHHSFTATYHEDREVTIEGELVTFLLRNPHTIVHVLAPDDSGEIRRWAIEWGAASALRSDVDRDSLKSGDQVIVTGNPGRDAGTYRMLLRAIERPSDGWKWSGSFD